MIRRAGTAPFPELRSKPLTFPFVKKPKSDENENDDRDKDSVDLHGFLCRSRKYDKNSCSASTQAMGRHFQVIWSLSWGLRAP